jgi:hypothetical protein
VSGHPKHLTIFRNTHLPSSTISARFAAVHTLYHSPELVDVKAQIMVDLTSRDIKFPNHTDLRHCLRSTITGEIIPHERRSGNSSLAEEIVDMTILHPVNFDCVVSRIKADVASNPLPSASSVSFVNLGPGSVLWRGAARSLSGIHLSMVDWSSASAADSNLPSGPCVETKSDLTMGKESIAIVGMAVKLPGANDASGLWEILEKGLNTVSEVCTMARDVGTYFSP